MVTKTEKRKFSDRLNQALDRAGFPSKGDGRQNAVGKEFKVTQKGARKWLEGEGIPHTKRLPAIAARLQVTVEWLLTGDGPMDRDNLTKRGGARTVQEGPEIRAVPLISWVAAGQWSEAVDTYRVGEGEKPVYTTKRVSSQAFALRVVGDSMVNPNGHPTFPPGSIIIVDPSRRPENKDAVIVRLDHSKDVTFKQLVIQDGGERWLKPLNPQYPPVRYDDSAVIVGVVVQTIIENTPD